MLDNFAGVLICAFSVFGLAVFFACLARLLAPKPFKGGFARIILHPQPGEGLDQLLLAARQAGAMFETFEIEIQGYPRDKVQAMLAALGEARMEEKWMRDRWRP